MTVVLGFLLTLQKVRKKMWCLKNAVVFQGYRKHCRQPRINRKHGKFILKTEWTKFVFNIAPHASCILCNHRSICLHVVTRTLIELLKSCETRIEPSFLGFGCWSCANRFVHWTRWLSSLYRPLSEREHSKMIRSIGSEPLSLGPQNSCLE